MLTSEYPEQDHGLQQSSTSPTRVLHPVARRRHHVYRDELLARLLIDLFMSRKEQYHEENHSSLNELS